MKKRFIILLLSAAGLLSCSDKASVTLPTFSAVSVSPEKAVYHTGDSVTCTVSMLTEGDASLKAATWWFYGSWWGSDPDMTADFCTPDTTAGTVSFTSSKIALTAAGEVRIYFWGRLEYPNWNFQPVQIPVTLKVEN